jgi:hypothetical protein
MKYFLHTSSNDIEQKNLRVDGSTTGVDSEVDHLDFSIAGPFTSVSSLQQWRRVTLHFTEPRPDDTSIELGTLSHEAIEGIGNQRIWTADSIPERSQSQSTEERGHSLLNSAIQRDGLFGSVNADNSISRTPLLREELVAQWFARILGVKVADPKLGRSDEEIQPELMQSIRRYPLNATDVTVWHQPGKRQGRGTQLWILLRIRWPRDAKRVTLKCIEVESQESGWERDLPQIYQESNTQESPQRQSTGQTGMPILLESLLRHFEFNANAQREKIQQVADWYVPTPQTTNLVELASHLGVHHEGLSDEQLLESLPQAFDRYLKRGTKESLLGVLRIIYKDFIESNAEGDAANPCRVENIQTQPAEVQSKWKKILDLYEPIKKCRIMVLNDLSCRLSDPNVVLSGSEPRVGSAGENAEPGRQLTGLRHLVGRAILQVSADAFPNDQERDNLRRLVDGLAPGNMRIVINYVHQSAILGLGTFVGESTVG